QAAKQHGISIRTLQAYRARLRIDPELTELFAAKKRLLEEDWRSEAVKTIRHGMGTLRRLFTLADKEAEKTARDGSPFPVGRIREVAGAVHLVGNLGIAKDALTGDDEPSADDRLGPGPPEGESSGDGGTAGTESRQGFVH
ncbi:MAG TPA: hypothetical protein VF382_05730, partial [Actinomycetota bacterium]